MTRVVRAAGWAAAGVGCALLLAGCVDQEPSTPAPTAAPPASTISARPTKPAASTTTALPGTPTPVSVGDSPVDVARLRSTDDLAAVFGCPATVPPIRLPATAPGPSTTVPAAPEAIVCASALADREAVYLWYCPTPEAKLGALTDALARAKYVRGGPNWVAAGQLDPGMGSVGGEVYR